MSHFWLAHTQLLDSALPIGTFSHSFGLETLVQDGSVHTAEELKAYAESMLFNAWALCDAAAIKAVYTYAPTGEWERLWHVDRALHVQRAARETREGLYKMGKRLLQLARTLYPTLQWAPLSEAIETQACIGSYPTIYGWACYQLEVPLDIAAEGYLYGCLTGCLNNAVRAMRLGQTQAQVIMSELLPTIREAWQEVAARAPEEFYTSTPMADIAMMQHETLYSRLFMS